MGKRKNEVEDFGLGNDNSDAYYGLSEKKKKPAGCIIAIIGVSILSILVVTLLLIKNANRQAVPKNNTARATSTFDLQDADVKVSRGLARASYNSSGQRIDLSDLQSQPVPGSLDSAPISIPAALSMESLHELDALSYPEGAIIDPQSGELIVFGSPSISSTSHSSDYFLTALRTVFDDQWPGVSIDPGESKTVQKVRYIGLTEGTNAGYVMFEADRVMKTLSLGEDNLTGQAVTSNVPGHGSMFDFEIRLGDQAETETRRRFWFVISNAAVEQNPDGQGMLIKNVRIEVKTEYLDSNWQTLPNQPPDPSGQAFAQQLTAHYDEYAREFPVFKQLKALAYWTVLAQWIKQSTLPIQSDLLLAQNLHEIETPKTTPAITVTKQDTQGNITQSISLWGGVNLAVNLGIEPATTNTKNLFQQVIGWVTNRIAPPLPGPAVGISPVTPEKAFQASAELSDLIGVRYRFAADTKQAGWSVDVPHMVAIVARATSETTVYLFTDPGQKKTVVLRRQGVDVESKNPIYTDVQSGLRLEVQPDGLMLLQGTFQEDGMNFSYDPDQYMRFDSSGSILEKGGPNGGKTTYAYSSGKLASIENPDGKFTCEYNGKGLIRGLQVNGNRYTFTYDDKDLPSEILDSQGQVYKKYEYVEQKRTWNIFDPTGKIVETVHLDPQNQISQIKRIVQEKTVVELYDWSSVQGQVYSGDALVPWWDASDQNLDDLKTMLRLQKRSPEFLNIVFTRLVGDRLLVLSADQTYSLPEKMLKDPSSVLKALSGLSQQVKGQKYVLISGGEAVDVGFQNLFPQAVPYTIESMDETQILKNIAVLQETRGFSPEHSHIINGIPQPDQLAAVELPTADQDAWEGKHDAMNKIITDNGFSILPVDTANLKTVFSTSSAFVIIVAHSDGTSVFLPNGNHFSIDKQLTETEIAQLKKNNPIILFLSCDSGTAKPGEFSLGKKLVDSGASLVVAPNGKLPVDLANELVKNLLTDKNRDQDVLKAIINAYHKTFPDGLIPNLRGGNKGFLKFIIGQRIEISTGGIA